MEEEIQGLTATNYLLCQHFDPIKVESIYTFKDEHRAMISQKVHNEYMTADNDHNGDTEVRRMSIIIPSTIDTPKKVYDMLKKDYPDAKLHKVISGQPILTAEEQKLRTEKKKTTESFAMEQAVLNEYLDDFAPNTIGFPDCPYYERIFFHSVNHNTNITGKFKYETLNNMIRKEIERKPVKTWKEAVKLMDKGYKMRHKSFNPLQYWVKHPLYNDIYCNESGAEYHESCWINNYSEPEHYTGWYHFDNYTSYNWDEIHSVIDRISDHNPVIIYPDNASNELKFDIDASYGILPKGFGKFGSYHPISIYAESIDWTLKATALKFAKSSKWLPDQTVRKGKEKSGLYTISASMFGLTLVITTPMNIVELQRRVLYEGLEPFRAHDYRYKMPTMPDDASWKNFIQDGLRESGYDNWQRWEH